MSCLIQENIPWKMFLTQNYHVQVSMSSDLSTLTHDPHDLTSPRRASRSRFPTDPGGTSFNSCPGIYSESPLILEQDTDGSGCLHRRQKAGYNDDVTIPLSICQPRLQAITLPSRMINRSLGDRIGLVDRMKIQSR